jgi:hypothetical protein
LRDEARLTRRLLELPAGVVDQRARRVDARLHLNELVARRLMLDQVLAEGLALARPIDRLVEAGLRESRRRLPPCRAARR